MNKPTQHKSHIPTFKSYEEEATWWDTHDVTDYLDAFKEPKLVVANKNKKVKSIFLLEESGLTSSINIRLEKKTLDAIRILAAKKGVGPTTLIRMWALEKLKEEHPKYAIT